MAAVAVDDGMWLALAGTYGPLASPLPQVLGIGALALGIPWWAHRRRYARVRVERTLAAMPDINRRIAAEISWTRTADCSASTHPAREAFLKRFEKEVDPDGMLPAEERTRRANHALRAYMLRLRKRAMSAKTS